MELTWMQQRESPNLVKILLGVKNANQITRNAPNAKRPTGCKPPNAG
jgi:hypothetical protein